MQLVEIPCIYTLDTCLTLSEIFDAAHKKASGRLRLLSKLREHVTSDAALKIYQMMILPIITYSGMIKLLLSREESFDLTVQSPVVENLPQQIVELPQRVETERQPSVEKQHEPIQELPPAPEIPAPTSLEKRYPVRHRKSPDRLKL